MSRMLEAELQKWCELGIFYSACGMPTDDIVDILRTLSAKVRNERSTTMTIKLVRGDSLQVETPFGWVHIDATPGENGVPVTLRGTGPNDVVVESVPGCNTGRMLFLSRMLSDRTPGVWLAP